MKLIEIKNVTKNYGSKEVLKNVNLDINKGEILALLGINGAGKTTLSGIISTLHPANSGEVLYLGKSIYDDIPEYRKKIGLCPQYANLNPSLNVEQNIYYSGLLYGISRAESKEKANNLIKRFNLEEFRESDISTLSGGYRQRVLIARTIMHNPELVIFDEPTTGLDPNIRRELWLIIKELKEFGTSIILTTHYIEEADMLADRICILKEGEIKIIDSPENLKKKFNDQNLENIFISLTGAKVEEFI